MTPELTALLTAIVSLVMLGASLATGMRGEAVFWGFSLAFCVACLVCWWLQNRR